MLKVTNTHLNIMVTIKKKKEQNQITSKKEDLEAENQVRAGDTAQ